MHDTSCEVGLGGILVCRICTKTVSDDIDKRIYDIGSPHPQHPHNHLAITSGTLQTALLFLFLFDGSKISL